MGAPLLKLFVYGTLKRGGQYHERFCRGVLEVEEASVWGRLHMLPEGYPGLTVPLAGVLAEGTSDPLVDAATQARFETHLGAGSAPSSEGWERVAGELMTFDDPAERLPILDAFEGFHPGAPSLYRRALVHVDCSLSGRIPAWSYVARVVVSPERS